MQCVHTDYTGADGRNGCPPGAHLVAYVIRKHTIHIRMLKPLNHVKKNLTNSQQTWIELSTFERHKEARLFGRSDHQSLDSAVIRIVESTRIGMYIIQCNSDSGTGLTVVRR